MLLDPYVIRQLELPNRLVVSPMAQYSALDGMPVDHHLVHYGGLARGGAGTVIVEATGVTREGRITNGCLGLWSDAHAQAFKPITRFIRESGAVAGIQIGHGGRKSSTQRPWHGNGPITETDIARGDERWEPIGPSSIPLSDGWPAPREMTHKDMADTAADFAAAARRALDAGFQFIEIHMAHGYLLQSFTTPLANQRTDEYGGSVAGRIRFPLEVVDAVREEVGADVPLFARISSVDGIDGGWEMDDSVEFAHALKKHSIDVIDCSSGGNSTRGATNANLKRGPGYQVPYAERIRKEVGIATQAVGLIRDIELAEQVLREGRADLIAVGRQVLFDPFLMLHQLHEQNADPDFARWPEQYAWWLEKWDKGIKAAEKNKD